MANNIQITVFTPSFNRSDLLRKLYVSLCRQTCRNFEWLIVDDGSTDSTEIVVNEWILEQKVDIVYYKQKNSGKHVAHNVGVALCKTELFFCVDSDDILTDDAIMLILSTWKNIPAQIKKIYSGIVAYRGINQNTLIGTEFPTNVIACPLKQLYRMGKKGDTALVFRTSVLRGYPFPVFKGEKFLRENLVYDLIDEKYSLFILRKIIYIGNYLSDGLTQNATMLEMKSPKGAALYRYKEYEKNRKTLYGIRQLAGYLFFSFKAGSGKEAIFKTGVFKSAILSPLVLIGAVRYWIILRK